MKCSHFWNSSEDLGSLGHSSHSIHFRPYLPNNKAVSFHYCSMCTFNKDKRSWFVPKGLWKFTPLAWNGSMKTRNKIEVRGVLWRDSKQHWGVLYAPVPMVVWQSHQWSGNVTAAWHPRNHGPFYPEGNRKLWGNLASQAASITGKIVCFNS